MKDLKFNDEQIKTILLKKARILNLNMRQFENLAIFKI